MIDEGDSGTAPGEWCSINEAARRLRVDPKTVRDWLAAVPPKLRERSRGNRGREVWVPEDERRDLSDHSGTFPELVALQVQAARLEERLAAGDERQADLRASLAEMREALVIERARADRLEAALAEARRPWLARVLEGLRRKG